MTAAIELREVCQSFPDAFGGRRTVLDGVSLSFGADLLTTLVGPNGSGKSTVLQIVAGTLVPDAGTVTRVADGPAAGTVGYLWQDYRASLLPWLDVADNIAFPLELRGVPRDERRRVAHDYLKRYAPDIGGDRWCYQLSGGQQQQVCLLRSLAARPDIVLLDEPFSALDQYTRWSMALSVERIWQAHRVPTIFVSHDVDESVLLSDRILLLSKARHRIAGEIRNPLPRPRGVAMITSEVHIACRKAVVEFLAEEDAIARHERP